MNRKKKVKEPVYMNTLDINQPKEKLSKMFANIRIKTLPRNTKCDFCVMALTPQVAAKMCRECRRPICDPCSETHHKNVKYKNHTFIAASQEGLSTLSCHNHPDEEIKHFCKPCKLAVCTKCRDSADHAKHQFSTFDEGLSSFRSDLTEKRLSMNAQLDKTRLIMKNTSDVEKQVQDDFNTVRKNANTKVDKLIEQAQEWKQRIESELVMTHQKETAIWSRRVEELQVMAAKLENVASFLDSVIGEDNDIKFIERSKDLDEPLAHPLITNEELLKPLTAPSVTLNTEKQGKDTNNLKIANQVSEILGELQIKTYNQAYENLDTLDMKGLPSLPKKVTASKPNAKEKPPVPAKATAATPDVPDGVKLRWTAEMGSASGQVCFPISVGFTGDGHTIVSEAGNKRVQCFDTRGNSLWNYGSEHNKMEPRGMAVSSEDLIYVTDVSKRGVCILNKDGTKVGAWGQLQLKYPKDIAVNSNGNIIVADKGNANILVCASDGRQLKSFGSKGTLDQQFQEPNYVKTDSHSRIIVSDTGNMEIKIFNSFGAFIRKFGPMAYGKRQLFHGIAIDHSDNILVALHDTHEIARFSPDGTYIESVLNRPDGIWRPATLSMSSQGYIAVGETQGEERHSAVKVYKL